MGGGGQEEGGTCGLKKGRDRVSTIRYATDKLEAPPLPKRGQLIQVHIWLFHHHPSAFSNSIFSNILHIILFSLLNSSITTIIIINIDECQ